MTRAESSGRLGRVLHAAEAASPVDAVEAVTRELGVALGATEVSFLIADLSGRALVRLSHVPLGPRRRGAPVGARRAPGCRRAGDGGAVRRGTGGAGCAHPDGAGAGTRRHDSGRRTAEQWTILAPMTERGEVIGVLELRVPHEPDPDALARTARLAHLWPSW